VLDGPQAPQPGVRYVVTLDAGLVKDATVVVVAHAEGLGDEFTSPRRVVVDRLLRWKGSRLKPVRLSEVEEAIELCSREYHHAPLHADPYQAVGLIQRLRARGVKASEFAFTSQSVGRVANALHLALRNRLLLLPDDQELIAELGRVRLRESSPGAVRLDHDSGEHDDQAVAIAIAVAVLQGEPRVGAAFLAAMQEELRRRESDPAARAEHPELRMLPRSAPLDRPVAGEFCEGRPHHRFQRVQDGSWRCLQCGGWRGS
jgi:hypothetical protein